MLFLRVPEEELKDTFVKIAELLLVQKEDLNNSIRLFLKSTF